MMKKRIYRYLFLLAACCGVLLSGCSREQEPTVNPTPEMVDVRFTLGVTPVNTVSTRGKVVADGDVSGFHFTIGESPVPETRSQILESEYDYLVDHLWVLQFSASGENNGALIHSQELTDLDFSFYWSEKTEDLELPLAYSDNCEIYFIANVPDLMNDPIVSISQFKSLAYSFSSQDEFPMVGAYFGSIPSVTGAKIELERLCAKITLSIYDDYSYPARFTVSSVQLKSASTFTYYYNRASYDNLFGWIAPEATTDYSNWNQHVFKDYAPETWGGYHPDYGYYVETALWYLPENRQGNAETAIYEQKYKWMENAPTYNIDGRGTSYATHIVIEMIFNDGSGDQDVTLTIFPGDEYNLENNFDIVRNNSYDISVAIRTLSSEDPRVEIRSPLAVIDYHIEYTGGGEGDIISGSGVAGAEIVVY